MGSKSLRYEVLVRPKTSAFREQQSTFSPFSADDDSPSNRSATTALFETKVQRFTCDRENMQQYWIPEGYRPVLIPRAYLADSLVASNNNSGHSMNSVNAVFNQLRTRINNNDNINDNLNDIERRRRNPNFNNSTSNNGGIKKRRRNNVNINSNRRTILGQSSPTVNINTIVHRQRIKERISAIRNSAVTITSSSSLKNNNNLSDRSPSNIIGEMWKVEPEKVKKHYERLAIRKKITQALAFEQKFSSSKSAMNHVHVRSTTPSSRHHHVNPATCPTTGSSYRFAVHSNAAKNFDNDNHQYVDSSSSSPVFFNDINRPVPDWMKRSDDEDYYDENDENSSDVDLDADNNSTITAIA